MIVIGKMVGFLTARYGHTRNGVFHDLSGGNRSPRIFLSAYMTTKWGEHHEHLTELFDYLAKSYTIDN